MRIAAVFASYNRREVALEGVSRLRTQTRLPDLVVVADNASTDGSVEALRGLEWDRLEVIETGGNLGNAGAVKAAMEHAFDRGFEAVWILDDDSWPRVDALEEMLRDPWDLEQVRHALQEDPKTGRFTWPLQVVDEDGLVRLVSSRDDLPAGRRIPTRGVWTGALVPRRIREVVGPVRADLFIRGEDEEYPWRIERAGFSSEAVTTAVLDHPGPDCLIRIRFMGKNLFFERGLTDWKLYYKIRNMVWLKRRQGGGLPAMAMALAYAWAIVREDGFRRLPLWWEAGRDGWKGRLGRWTRQP